LIHVSIFIVITYASLSYTFTAPGYIFADAVHIDMSTGFVSEPPIQK